MQLESPNPLTVGESIRPCSASGDDHSKPVAGLLIPMVTSTSEYTGETSNNVPHGHGVLRSTVGTVYTGSFVYGKFHGRGTCVTVDGRKYEGSFYDGLRHEQGTCSLPDGSYYSGAYFRDEQHGFGILTAADGSRYEGNFAHNHKHGAGLLIFANGTSTYKGDFEKGCFHGHGVCRDEDGNTYTGNFRWGSATGEVRAHSRTETNSKGTLRTTCIRGTVCARPPMGGSMRGCTTTGNAMETAYLLALMAPGTTCTTLQAKQSIKTKNMFGETSNPCFPN